MQGFGSNPPLLNILYRHIMSSKIKVLIIDDSAMTRQILAELLSHDPDLEVVGAAADPIIAQEKIARFQPDVITLDVEMPRMDGLSFLERLMASKPMPVVMVSSLTERGCETALRALQLGAIDIVTKPRIDIKEKLPEIVEEIAGKIKAAAKAKVRPRAAVSLDPPKRNSADVILKMNSPAGHSMIKTTDRIIAVGASTGGTEALAEFLSALPADSPGIVIVQHMPEKFTTAFAQRLDSICRVGVSEARDGDRVISGHALLAPGNFHMLLNRSGARYYVEVKEGPPVNRHRPSVDVLFRSVAKYAGRNAIGIIMTGMGDDGARGMKEMKDAGAFNIAQDEASCVVFGMPKEAIDKGGVDSIISIRDIKDAVIDRLKER